MTIKLSSRSMAIQPSATLAVSALAAQMRLEGRDIISLTTGEPDFDTPEPIKNAAIEAIHAGFTKYTAVDGTLELKQAVINKFKQDNQLEYALNQILISCGAKQSLFNLIEALIDPEDEVIIPAPYWVSYPDMVKLTGGHPVIIPTDIDHQFKISPEQLDKAINDQTKLVILNSPCNPSGQFYTASELRSLGNVLLKYPHVVIVTDDIYEHIIWDNTFVTLLNVCPGLYERTVVVNGVSKAYAMTGWRIGYAAGPSSLIASMKKIQSQSTSNPCSIAQMAAKAALEKPIDFSAMQKTFKERLVLAYEELSKIEGVRCLYPQSTFYLFPNVQGIIERLRLKDDIELSQYLLNEVGVAVVPGTAFGNPGYIRLSCATHMEALKEALKRIRQVFK